MGGSVLLYRSSCWSRCRAGAEGGDRGKGGSSCREICTPPSTVTQLDKGLVTNYGEGGEGYKTGGGGARFTPII